jgi:hypothetical protein
VKDCWVVDCPPVDEATIQAIYSCLEFSNITSRFDPETTAANVREGMIAHARIAERELYRQMAAESKLVRTNTQVVGATRHILVEMDKLIAYYRDRHRLDENVSLTWMAPQRVRDLMRADIAYPRRPVTGRRRSASRTARWPAGSPAAASRRCVSSTTTRPRRP